MAINIKKPPIIVLLLGTSFIPKIGSHTQKIPPITSVRDNNVSSAAWIFFEPTEYKIRPIQTNEPCKENKLWFFGVDKTDKSLIKITIKEKIQQYKPAMATVVNLGVSFLHRRVTENIEKPIDEVIP